CVIFIFFFSSRRRHTRFSRDWSSDVCSSDLQQRRNHPGQHRHQQHRRLAKLANPQPPHRTARRHLQFPPPRHHRRLEPQLVADRPLTTQPRDGRPDRPKPPASPRRSSPPTSLASAASSLYNAPLSSSTRPPPHLFKGL